MSTNDHMIQSNVVPPIGIENDSKFNNLQFGCFEFEQGEFEPQKEHLGFGKDLVWSHDFKIHPRIAQTSRTREVQARDSRTMAG